MTATTKSAPGRRVTGITGARTPSLDRKAGTVDHILHQRLARQEQRRAARMSRTDTARRLVRLEVWMDVLQAQVSADSIVLGATSVQLAGNPGAVRFTASDPEPSYGPPASHPEAESLPLGAEDDVMLAGWSLDLWPQDEFEQIIQSVKPVLAGPVWYCPRCGNGSSAGPCGCGGQS